MTSDGDELRATRGMGETAVHPVRAQQADGADRNQGAVDRTTRSVRQHIGEPLGSRDKTALRATDRWRAMGGDREKYHSLGTLKENSNVLGSADHNGQ